MNVLSLFSGAGGLDLGLERAGHRIVGMCEIDPDARRVLRRHWPDVELHDDVTTLDGSVFRGRVDVVAGGSPCQDLSVAGRRAGLVGERSGLFWHQCRIAAQAAARWVLWENVAGALSSNDGRDFAAVLWGLTGTRPDVPADGWRSVGVCVGPERTAVWRVFDARWFGVAQRRRRVFVVAGARNECELAVLVDPESCGGDPRARPTSGPVAPGAPDRRTDKDRRHESVGSLTAMDGWERPDNAHAEAGWLVPTLTARCGATFDDQQTGQLVTYSFDSTYGANSNVFTDGTTPPVKVGSGLGIPSPPAVYARTHRAADDTDADTWVATDVAPTLNTNDTAAGPARSTVLAADTVVGVRRLTPRECERLMGWPDDHTRWADDGSELSDSARYRLCGNGVVAPVAEWIGRRLPR